MGDEHERRPAEDDDPLRLGDPRIVGWWRVGRTAAPAPAEGLEIVERRGRRTAFSLLIGWLLAGVAAASLDDAGAWWMSLPVAVTAIAASLSQRRIVRVDRSGLTVKHSPFGRAYTLPRADIAHVSADGSAASAGWSVTVRTRSGESRRLAGGGLTAERARDIADRVRSEVR